MAESGICQLRSMSAGGALAKESIPCRQGAAYSPVGARFIMQRISMRIFSGL